MAEQLEIRIGVPYAIHVDAIAISNDNRDAFHRNFDAITEPRSAQLRNSQFLSKLGEKAARTVASCTFHGEMVEKWMHISLIKLFLTKFRIQNIVQSITIDV